MITMKGAAVSAKLKEQVEKGLETLTWVPKLTIIRVGENPDDISYEKGATKKLTSFGLEVESKVFPGDISDEAFKKEFAAINADASVDGILMLRPLPKQINEKVVLRAILPEKDVDGFHPVSVGLLSIGDEGFAPATPSGIMAIFKEYGIEVAGKNCVVIGRSNIVGKPMAALLLQHDATVTICHSKTQNLAEITRRADIVIVATGRRNTLTADMVKDGVVVVDVGMNRNELGKLCGDVDFAQVKEKASFITPVPGGVGPMTITELLENTILAAQRHHR